MQGISFSLLAALVLSSTAFSQEEPSGTVDEIGTEAASEAAPEAASEAAPEEVSEAAPEEVSEAASEDELAAAQIDPAELDAFRSTLGRYSKRVTDFEKEVASIIQEQKEVEEQAIVDEYKQQINNLQDDVSVLRSTSQNRYEDFLNRYPKSDQSALVMIQLADLYFDQAIEILFNTEDSELDDDAEFGADYTKSITLYKKVIDNFPNSSFMDRALYMYGYCHLDDYSLNKDYELATETFQQLVEDFPESGFSAQANYNIGRYYFDETNEVTKSMPYFQESMSLTDDLDDLHEFSLYRLAWAHYVKDDFDKSLSLMVDLLDLIERKFQQTGQEGQTKPEAIEYIAFSFTDIADRSDKKAYQVADEFFSQMDERKYEPDVSAKMADLLVLQQRVVEAIDTYEHLQTKWPLAEKNPIYQKTIADLFIEMEDVDAYYDTMEVLSQRYNENSDWWRENRNNPKALDRARGYIEVSLRQVADRQFARAAESGEQEDFSRAADLYGEYLSKFPFADGYYVAQWFMCEALMLAQRFEDASLQYQQMLKSRENHDYEPLVKLRLNEAYRFLVNIAQDGDFLKVPDNAEQEGVIKLDSGDEFSFFRLGDIQQRYINSFSALESTDFDKDLSIFDDKRKAALQMSEEAEEEEEKTKYSDKAKYFENMISDTTVFKDFLNENKSQTLLVIAQILQGHGRITESRDWLTRILADYLEAPEAVSAAYMLVEGYQNLEEWEKVRDESRRLTDLMVPMAERKSSALANDFLEFEKNAALLIARNLLKEGERLMAKGRVEEGSKKFAESGEAFEQFLMNYSNIEPDLTATVMLLSAQSYESAGNTGKANDIYRKYVDNFPGKKESRSLLFVIATNYQDSLDYENAIKYFQILYNQTYGRGIEYPDAINALYNTAILKVGMGDYAGAAKGLEKFAQKFPNVPNVEQDYFKAGTYWEKVSEWKGLEFYTRYLKKYGGQNTDNTMEAYYRRIKIYEKMGKKPKQIEREWDFLYEQYLKMKEEGKDGPLMRKYGGMALSRKIPQELAKLEQYKYKLPANKKNDPKNAEMALTTMQVTLKEIVEYCDPLQKIGDYDTLIASYYCLGEARLYYAYFLRQYPIPEYLGENAVILYEEKMDELASPLEEEGMEILENTFELAERQQLWSEWTTASLNSLATYFKAEYALEKEELRVVTPSQYVRQLGPISIRTPDMEDAEDVEEETPVQEDAPSDDSEEAPSGNEVEEVGPSEENGADSTDDSTPVEEGGTEESGSEEDGAE
jgi:TolA-binding protein